MTIGFKIYPIFFEQCCQITSKIFNVIFFQNEKCLGIVFDIFNDLFTFEPIIWRNIYYRILKIKILIKILKKYRKLTLESKNDLNLLIRYSNWSSIFKNWNGQNISRHVICSCMHAMACHMQLFPLNISNSKFSKIQNFSKISKKIQNFQKILFGPSNQNCFNYNCS